MRCLLLYPTLLIATILYSQNGNTVGEAIDIDGTDVLNLLAFQNATASDQNPPCGSISEDVFYLHDISPGDNKLTITMVTTLITLLTTMEYQILMAPNGDTGNIQEVECGSYNVQIGLGGSFTKIINNVDPLGDYYMRIRKRTDLVSMVLDDLINNTTITMISEYDPTLSLNNINADLFRTIVTESIIKILGRYQFYGYDIYNLGGKRILKEDTTENIKTINISGLSKGIYILNLKSNDKNQMVKFVKY